MSEENKSKFKNLEDVKDMCAELASKLPQEVQENILKKLITDLTNSHATKLYDTFNIFGAVIKTIEAQVKINDQVKMTFLITTEVAPELVDGAEVKEFI